MKEPAMIDVSCPKCGRKFGWFGTMKDRPPCPRCQHQLPQAELDEAELRMADLRRRIDTHPKDAKDRDLMEMRKLAGLTLRQAAAQLGIAPSELSDYEWCRKPLPPEMAEKMSETYGCGG